MPHIAYQVPCYWESPLIGAPKSFFSPINPMSHRLNDSHKKAHAFLHGLMELYYTARLDKHYYL